MLLEASFALLELAKLEEPKLPCEIRDGYEGCLLHHVASVDGARLLIDLLPCHELLKHQQREGFTPIHHASSKVSEFLVLRGGVDNINAKSRSGLTPLFVVNNGATARTLLKLGANPNATNTYKHNPLHLATSHGLWDVVWFLLQAGGDATQAGFDGYTPLTLCNKLLCDIIGTQRPNTTQQDIQVLTKVKRMLEIWEQCEKTTPVEFSQNKFQLFEQQCSAAAHASICKDPPTGLSNATNLPIELAQMILYQYVGMFKEADDLIERNDKLFVPRNRWRYKINKLPLNNNSSLELMTTTYSLSNLLQRLRHLWSSFNINIITNQQGRLSINDNYIIIMLLVLACAFAIWTKKEVSIIGVGIGVGISYFIQRT